MRTKNSSSRLRNIATTILIFASMVSLSSVAATAKKAHAKAPVEPSQVVGPQFNPDASSLPARFTGNNFLALYRQLSVEGKGEFEKDEDYKRRKQLVSPGVYAFILPQIQTRYNADDQGFTTKIDPDFVYQGRSRADRDSMLVVRETKVTTGKYVGSNAFGASMVVKRLTIREWGILLRGQRPFDSMKIWIPVEPVRARELKDRLRLLAVVGVGPESVPERMLDERDDKRDATGFDFSGATIDAPVDLSNYYYAIPARVIGLWAFDVETGTVFGKFDIAGQSLSDVKSDVQNEYFNRLIVGMAGDEVWTAMGRRPDRIVTAVEKSGDTFQQFDDWIYERENITARFSKDKQRLVGAFIGQPK